MTDDDAGCEPVRLLLPVPGLGLSTSWDVGQVRFHPAGATTGLIESADTVASGAYPAWFEDRVSGTAAELDRWAVADVTVRNGLDEATPLAASALAVLRAIQHMESPMTNIRQQTFGLPGQATSAVISYVRLTGGAAPGWRRTGTLAGWTFSDSSRAVWISDPAYRFLDQALRQPEASRTQLQRRALVAIELLSNAWLSRQPDVAFLNAVMALEVLLGEDNGTKKYLIAQRVSYFTCGWLGEVYADGSRATCPLLALPLKRDGTPGAALKQVFGDIQAGKIRACTQFFDVLVLYEARNKIVHDGKLGLTTAQESWATWFIAARLLHRVLTWFAQHDGSDLTKLDAEIAAAPAGP